LTRENVIAGRWVRVAEQVDLGEMGDEEGIGVDCDGHPIALFKLEGMIYALDDICSHEFSRLSEGEVWDGEVYCPKHGSRFNIKSGVVKGLPAIKSVRSYPVKVEKGEVFVLWDE
jgi:nitrite reductase/ring-hydroxylating ferredoxin subunit